MKISKPTNLEETPKSRKISDPEKERENKREITNRRKRNSKLRRKNINLLPSIASPNKIRNLYISVLFVLLLLTPKIGLKSHGGSDLYTNWYKRVVYST